MRHARKLNILYVSEYFSPRIGGGENWLLEVAQAVAAKGHNVHVVTSRLPGTEAHERMGGIHVWRPFPSGALRQRIRFMRFLRRYLADFIAEHRIDIVHTNAYIPTLPGAQAGRERNVPVVSSVHLGIGRTWFRITNPLSAALNWFNEYYIIRRSPHTLVHVTARSTEKRMRGYTRSPVVTIYNFLDPAPFRAAYKRLDVDAVRRKHRVKGKLLLYVGSLLPVKNIVATVQAVERAHKEGEELTFLIAGSGPEKERLQQLIGECTADIRLIGTIHDDEKLSLIGSCDAFLLLSRSEQFPLTVLEALGLDRHVIATKVGGIPDIAREHVTDKLHLIDSLDELPDALRAIPRQSRKGYNNKVFETYSKERTVGEFLKIYDRVLRQKHSG